MVSTLVSTNSSFKPGVPVGDGLLLGMLFKDNITLDGLGSRKKLILDQKLTIPMAFFECGENHREIYVEAIQAYLFGLPNSSIAMVSKCMQVALKKRLALNNITELTFKAKNGNGRSIKLDGDVTLYNLIESNEVSSLLKDLKEEAQYLRVLRNHIHDDKMANNFYAFEALCHLQKILSILFPNPREIFIKYLCVCCNKYHVDVVPASNYFAGSKATFECRNPPKGAKADSNILLKFTDVTINI